MKRILIFVALFCATPYIIKAQQDTLSYAVTIPKPVVVKLVKTPEALGISEKVQKRNSAFKNLPTNIALFAVDRRSNEGEGNSDVVMIISIDQLTKKIKMSSLMRDTYVTIENNGKDKLNAAYAKGGPQLAIKTINQNFDLDIKDYINVDFFSAAKIVDALGGVNINVKPAELSFLNNYLYEISLIEKIPSVPLTTAGLQKLDGKQTVAYTRIRGVGRGDYDRTERQRNVLVALFSKMQGAGPDIFPVFMNEILPNLETSMSSMTLFTLGSNILNSKTKVIEQARFPLDSASKGERINNVWYLNTDLKATSTSIYNFIYKNIQPGK